MTTPVRQPSAAAGSGEATARAGGADPPEGIDHLADVPVAAPPLLSGSVVPNRALNPDRRRRRGGAPIVVSYLVTVFVLITFNFALPRLMPGNPIDSLLIQGQPNYVQNDVTRARLEEYYRIDGSIPQQYLRYLRGMAHGDFGVSVVSNRPVTPELLSGVPWTLLLIMSSTVLGIVIGIPGGVHSGWKRDGRLDRGLLAFFMAWQNVPLFVLASLAFVIFTAKLGLFPPGGGVTPLSGYTGLAQVLDIARHLALPALTMCSLFASSNFLLMRSAMVIELGSDYLVVGRAKGLRERRLKYRYTGRNALLPVVTSIGVQVGTGLIGVIFIERIFAYPGVGQYMFGAIGTRDYPAMQGSFLLLTMSVVTANLLVDLLYRRLDPRTAP